MKPLNTLSEPSADEGSPTPRVVLSRCLELDEVRFNGSRIPCDVVRHLTPYVEWIPVCPEVSIGLGVPRDPVRLVQDSSEGARRAGKAAEDGSPRLVQPSTDRDLTDAMTSFAEDFLHGVGAVDGFLLKNRSPSCGPGDVKVYPGRGGSPVDRGVGLFAAAVLERGQAAAVEDEGRLRNFRIREHFLTRLFSLARLRKVAESGGMADLVRFQARHKLLLMAYDQEAMRTLGRIAANPDRRSFDEVISDYRDGLSRALAAPPSHTAVINVLHHGLGHVKEELTSAEKAFFLDAVERYRNGRTPLAGATEILRAWAVRFDNDYLLDQVLFRPYPEPLASLSDSGKGGAHGRGRSPDRP